MSFGRLRISFSSAKVKIKISSGFRRIKASVIGSLERVAHRPLTAASKKKLAMSITRRPEFIRQTVCISDVGPISVMAEATQEQTIDTTGLGCSTIPYVSAPATPTSSDVSDGPVSGISLLGFGIEDESSAEMQSVDPEDTFMEELCSYLETVSVVYVVGHIMPGLTIRKEDEYLGGLYCEYNTVSELHIVREPTSVAEEIGYGQALSEPVSEIQVSAECNEKSSDEDAFFDDLYSTIEAHIIFGLCCEETYDPYVPDYVISDISSNEVGDIAIVIDEPELGTKDVSLIDSFIDPAVRFSFGFPVSAEPPGPTVFRFIIGTPAEEPEADEFADGNIRNDVDSSQVIAASNRTGMFIL